MGTTHYTRIHKISSTGNLLWTQSQEISSQPSQKVIAAALNGGCVVQIDSSTIGVFSSSGDALWSNSSFSDIIDLRIAHDGSIYVLDAQGLHRLNSAGYLLWVNND